MNKDAIDLVMEQWRQERSDLDVSSIGVFGHISRLSRLVGLTEKKFLRQLGLEPWEYEVLAILRRSGPTYAVSPKEIGRASLVSSGALTNRLDHLEQAGLVERHPDPQDRRALIITLTAKGRERADQVVGVYLQQEEELLSPLSARERHTTADLLRKLLVFIEGTGRTAPGQESAGVG